MNDMNRPEASGQPIREDILIGRVVDGEAFASDWEELERLAMSDPGVWERVGRAQRIHARLEHEVEDAIAVAELVELPQGVAPVERFSRVRQYGGWAAAAVLALAFIGQGWLGQPWAGVNQQAGIVKTPALSLDDALSQYLQAGQAAGRVVSEMQPFLVQSRELGQGEGQEVWYIRPILERAKVTDISVMSVQRNEHGAPMLIPVEPSELMSPQGIRNKNAL